MMIANRQNKIPMPSEAESKISDESNRLLAAFEDLQSPTQTILLQSKTGKKQTVQIPTIAYELLMDILA
ncbi:MAG: hypothetical protein ACRC80_26575 [Waterburya sp.]